VRQSLTNCHHVYTHFAARSDAKQCLQIFHVDSAALRAYLRGDFPNCAPEESPVDQRKLACMKHLAILTLVIFLLEDAAANYPLPGESH
jgi:hypothetical protein